MVTPDIQSYPADREMQRGTKRLIPATDFDDPRILTRPRAAAMQSALAPHLKKATRLASAVRVSFAGIEVAAVT